LAPKKISEEFYERFNVSPDEIMDDIYSSHSPSRWLSEYAVFLSEHIDDDYVSVLVKNELKRFFERNILQYDYDKHSVSFVGKIACLYSDMLRELAINMGIKVEKIDGKKIMKRIYIYFFLTFLYTIGYAQNADFDLSLKLNTQSNRYYFEVVLTNTSSDATYTFNRSSDSCLGGYPHACILVPELEYKDGSMHEGLDLGFFYFTHEGKKELKILPGESYSCNIAYLCEQQIMGMLRRSDLGNVKQIRVRLKKFKALKTGNKYFDVIDTTLYSNWIDIK
jgi:hypothetical protein